MWQKIKVWFEAKKQSKKHNIEMKKMKDYYEKLQCGALFLSFVHQEFAKQKKQMNRPERRRWEASLVKKGQFSREIVEYYMKHIDKITANINKELEKRKTK